MLKERRILPSLLLISIFLIAACSSQPEAAEVIEPSSEEVMDEEAMDEEAMEEEMTDDEMADEEMMGDDIADEEMMEDDIADEEMMEDDMSDQQTTFVIRIENTSPEDGLTVLAPGAYELNDHPLSFFTPGEADLGLGLEALAEDGDPSVLAGSISEMMGGDQMAGFAVSVFNTPVGADAPGPAGPGAAYEFSIEAYPGQYLTLATMFVQSNDWFFAPGVDGLELFDADGNPISGDITSQIFLWNAGTEVDQTPGEGVDQAPRQAGPNTGEGEDGLVSLVDGFTNYQILVTITPQS
jgi:hypothetical protein